MSRSRGRSIFTYVPHKKVKRNKFDLSHVRKTTGLMGTVYPCFLQDVLPGDTFEVQSLVFLRTVAMLAPVMHKFEVCLDFFFVPNRLMWFRVGETDGWENFITGGPQGNLAPVPPKFALQDVYTSAPVSLRDGQLLDALGFPTMRQGGVINGGYTPSFSAFPLLAYTLVWDTFYRDQSWQGTVLPASFGSGGTISVADLGIYLAIRPGPWQKDYLTSAQPWAQRGAVQSVSMVGGVVVPNTGSASAGLLRRSDNTNPVGAGAVSVVGASGNIQAAGTAVNLYYDPNGSMSVTSSFSVASLRLANAMQEYLEINARSGSRYSEWLKGQFGVISSDARLQRPEYLGGGRAGIALSEVLQTAPAAGGSTPLAQLAGHAMSVGSTSKFKKYFEEHGFVIGMIMVRPMATYQDIIEKFWVKLVNTDYFVPALAKIGEQNVYSYEAYSMWSDAASVNHWADVIGYQSRYAEYKFKQSLNTGMMKDTYGYWTAGRVFTGYPANAGALVPMVVRGDMFAVTPGITTPPLIFEITHSVQALRPIPYFDVPNL